MAGPFPGMDPWLEHPAIWSDVHNRLVTVLANHLGPRLRPRYYVGVEERTYLQVGGSPEPVGRPDLTVTSPDPEANQEPEPAASTPASSPTVLTVDVPLPDEVVETYLEVRQVGTDEVVTVIELLSPANKLAAGAGREAYEGKRLKCSGHGPAWSRSTCSARAAPWRCWA